MKITIYKIIRKVGTTYAVKIFLYKRDQRVVKVRIFGICHFYFL